MMLSGGKEHRIKPMGDSAANDIFSEFEEIKSASSLSYEIGRKNFNLYAPGQASDMFSDPQNAAHMAQSRTPKIYNMIPMYVEGITANLLMNVGDPKFVPNEEGIQDTVLALQQKYYSDKDFFRYNGSLLSAVVNGLIFRGIEEIFIKPTKKEPLGRIGFKNINPLMIYFDPNVNEDDWVTASKKAFKEFYLSPREVAAIYPKLAKDLQISIERKNRHADQYEPKNSTDPPPDQSKWGTKYRLIEHYYIESKNEQYTYDSLNGIVLPNTEHAHESEQDVLEKIDWLRSNNYDFEPELMTSITKNKETLMLATIYPELGLVLEHGKDQRQIENESGEVRLPFFGYSYVMKNGITNSVIDTIKDAQNDINLREAQKTKLFTKSPLGNKTIIHPWAFGHDVAKREEMLRDYTDSSKPLIPDASVPPGLMTSLIHTQQGSMINQSIFQDESFKIDMMNKSGRFNPAMQGMSERSGESAKHFKGKVFEGSMLQKVPSERLYEYNKQKQEAWLSLAILIYGGHDEKSRIANLEKSFMYKDKSITLNKISKAKEENGKLVELEVENDVYSISREDITIASTKNNEYYNQMKKAELEESLARLPMDPQHGALRALLTKELVDLNETMNADQKETMNDMNDLSMRVAMKRLQYEEAQLDSGIQQAMMASTGMTNAQPIDNKGISPVAKQSEGSLNGPSQRA